MIAITSPDSMSRVAHHGCISLLGTDSKSSANLVARDQARSLSYLMEYGYARSTWTADNPPCPTSGAKYLGHRSCGEGEDILPNLSPEFNYLMKEVFMNNANGVKNEKNSIVLMFKILSSVGFIFPPLITKQDLKLHFKISPDCVKYYDRVRCVPDFSVINIESGSICLNAELKANDKSNEYSTDFEQTLAQVRK